jgi:phospholipase C
MSPIVNQSLSTQDLLTGPGACGDGTNTALPGPAPNVNAHAQGRCGYGPRLPLIVVSPWAKENFVDHTDRIRPPSFISLKTTGWTASGCPGGSFDAISNSIEQMFDFSQSQCRFGDNELSSSIQASALVRSHSGW